MPYPTYEEIAKAAGDRLADYLRRSIAANARTVHPDTIELIVATAKAMAASEVYDAMRTAVDELSLS
jgi:TRAP-type C4-dicarboxylate transport system substrate-binding protein